MVIKSITTEFTGEVGALPRLVRIVVDDLPSVFMVPGYLNSVARNGYPIYPTDFIHLTSTADGSFNIYNPKISNGVISLLPQTAQNITPGSTSFVGNLLKYIREDGATGDSGIPATSIPQFPGSSVVGNIPDFTNTTGGMQDSGIAIASLATYSGATVANNLVKATNTTGTIADLGARILSGTTTIYAGGGTSNAFTVSGLTASSHGSCILRTSTNVVAISAVPSTNTLTVTFASDPGAGTTLDYVYTTAGLT
jgi:hypothetical protein